MTRIYSGRSAALSGDLEPLIKSRRMTHVTCNSDPQHAIVMPRVTCQGKLLTQSIILTLGWLIHSILMQCFLLRIFMSALFEFTHLQIFAIFLVKIMNGTSMEDLQSAFLNSLWIQHSEYAKESCCVSLDLVHDCNSEIDAYDN